MSMMFFKLLCKRWLRFFLVVAPIFIVFLYQAEASVIRHDVDEKHYIVLATQPQFRASRVGFYYQNRAIFSGTLIGPRHVLTTGHGVYMFLPRGRTQGRVKIDVKVNGEARTGVYAFLHPKYSRGTGFGGADIAIVRLDRPVTNVSPASIWTAGLNMNEAYIGVGLGTFTTATQKRFLKGTGTFRAFMNCMDYFGEHSTFHYFIADLDNNDQRRNTLAYLVVDYANENFEKYIKIKGRSDKKPLPLEGVSAPGDSGGGIWIHREGKVYIGGVVSYGHNAISYGVQSGNLSLSDPKIAYWIKAVSNKENGQFKVTSPKAELKWPPEGQPQIEENLKEYVLKKFKIAPINRKDLYALSTAPGMREKSGDDVANALGLAVAEITHAKGDGLGIFLSTQGHLLTTANSLPKTSGTSGAAGTSGVSGTSGADGKISVNFNTPVGSRQTADAEVLAKDKQSPLVLLKVAAKHPFKWMTIEKEKKLSIGKNLLFVRNKKADQFASGMLINTSRFAGGNLHIQFNRPQSDSLNGSPLVNEFGNLAGMVNHQPGNEKLLAIPYQAIRKFLESVSH